MTAAPGASAHQCPSLKSSGHVRGSGAPRTAARGSRMLPGAQGPAPGEAVSLRGLLSGCGSGLCGLLPTRAPRQDKALVPKQHRGRFANRHGPRPG